VDQRVSGREEGRDVGAGASDSMASGVADPAIATAQEAIHTAERADHWFTLCYVLLVAGCPVSPWVGDVAEAHDRIDRHLSEAHRDSESADLRGSTRQFCACGKATWARC
jgi:hypothetical protein